MKNENLVIGEYQNHVTRLHRELSSQLYRPVQIRMIVIPVDLAVISFGSDINMDEPGQ